MTTPCSSRMLAWDQAQVAIVQSPRLVGLIRRDVRNDLTQGLLPLFFLDYFASARRSDVARRMHISQAPARRALDRGETAAIPDLSRATMTSLLLRRRVERASVLPSPASPRRVLSRLAALGSRNGFSCPQVIETTIGSSIAPPCSPDDNARDPCSPPTRNLRQSLLPSPAEEVSRTPRPAAGCRTSARPARRCHAIVEATQYPRACSPSSGRRRDRAAALARTSLRCRPGRIVSEADATRRPPLEPLANRNERPIERATCAAPSAQRAETLSARDSGRRPSRLTSHPVLSVQGKDNAKPAAFSSRAAAEHGRAALRAHPRLPYDIARPAPRRPASTSPPSGIAIERPVLRQKYLFRPPLTHSSRTSDRIVALAGFIDAPRFRRRWGGGTSNPPSFLQAFAQSPHAQSSPRRGSPAALHLVTARSTTADLASSRSPSSPGDNPTPSPAGPSSRTTTFPRASPRSSPANASPRCLFALTQLPRAPEKRARPPRAPAEGGGPRATTFSLCSAIMADGPLCGQGTGRTKRRDRRRSDLYFRPITAPPTGSACASTVAASTGTMSPTGSPRVGAPAPRRA